MKKKKIKKPQFRSGLEKRISQILDASLLSWKHESVKLKYVVPERKATYLPDFHVEKYPKLIVEAKGIFSAADRKKMLLVKEQYPDHTVVMIFGRAKNKLRKGSNTSYSDWCDQHDILWIDVEDFAKDPNTCLLHITRKAKSGNSQISPPKRSQTSSKLARKPSSGKSQSRTRKRS